MGAETVAEKTWAAHFLTLSQNHMHVDEAKCQQQQYVWLRPDWTNGTKKQSHTIEGQSSLGVNIDFGLLLQ